MVWRSLKTLNIESPFDLAIPLLGIQTKEVKTGLWTDTYISVFTGAFFMIVKRWKQPIYPSSGWMDKQNTVHTKDGILFILEEKGNTDAAVTWMNFKDIILSETGQKYAPKTNTMWFYLYEVPRAVKFHRQNVEQWLPVTKGRKEWRVTVEWVQSLSSGWWKSSEDE